MDFIGIDIGTSGCKAMVISQEGTIVKTAKLAYEMYHTQPGWAYLRIDLIWESVKQVLREIAPFCGNVQACMVSSLGETMVLLDQADNLLIKEGITYLDSRNGEIWSRLRKDKDLSVIQEKTGKTNLKIAMVNQYHYWKEQCPQAFLKAKRLLFLDSFVTYMLSGMGAMDYSTASNSLIFNIKEHGWDQALAEEFQVDPGLFPPAVPIGTCLGKIRPKMAEELGLPETIKIFVGCHDQTAATVGGKAAQRGNLVLGQGSTEALNFVIAKEDLPRVQDLEIAPFLDEKQYVVRLSRFANGNCINWFVKNFGASLTEKGKIRPMDYDILNERCPDCSEGVIFLPYLSNTYFPDVDACMGTFTGMSVSTDVFHMYRAMLEGISCETRAMFRILDGTGIPITKIQAAGGAANSKVYMQIKADITGRTIAVSNKSEAGTAGLAMICAVNCGCYGNLEEAQEVFVKNSDIYDPKTDMSRVIEKYTKTSEAVRALYQN